MKVGIITIHHTSNYGAVLQAFALSQFIRSQGHEVEIIDYQPQAANEFYWKAMRFLNRSGLLGMPRFDQASFKRYWKYIKFQKFFKKYLPLSKTKFSDRNSLKQHAHQYDLVIAGSDQIWCLDNPFRGFDPSFFLDFIASDTGCVKASYAASCGSSNTFGDRKDEISGLINQIDHISVRDGNSLRLVKQECGRDQVTLVLDPTFLGDYRQLIAKPRLKNKYLLLYKHGALNERENCLIKKIADKKDLDIVSVGSHSSLAKHNFAEADPKEWLGLFNQADHIVTNTFHGTIFSLLFKRNFTVIANPSKQNKIQDLLSRFGLDKNIFNFEADDNFDWDNCLLSEARYDELWQAFSPEIEHSKHFLMTILSSPV
ncbi:MAG: polysaccharide pyruvyl transferase family protein [Moorea sp. SIOASIH]|uniref:polysaccharide pyruvyl transferase family protein n=1 Tax=Moorena sp. SIOASIH TaxID=2607817 RepID=UPI0013BB4CAD|nr:polysaccharide pyruvyl transferase family protein [Moorena sp. SIOASIH]NEO36142.1 polysaccharide pyruvyl transferase family protein [Moorena sp. SIOASIH]